MHELGIAQALVEQVEAARMANGGGRVLAVDVRIGTWRQVVPEILSSYVEHLTRGTPLEAARIDIQPVQAVARCGRCGDEFALVDVFLVCPRCGALGCTLLTGKELDLVGMELE
jgi:hydrogenase nickel incorporation protein HypA/HybF